MGLFYQKYKQCLEEFNAVKDDKYDSVSMARDPKGYLDYRTKQRWYETRLTSAQCDRLFHFFHG